MYYREIAPCEALRQQIHTYWILTQDALSDASPEKVLPDGRTEILFDFGAPYRWVGQAPLAPRGRVVGQIRSYIELIPSGPVALLGVRLEASALQRLIGSTAGELTGTSAPFDELELFELAALEERLHELSSWSARLELVERVFMKLLLAPGRTDSLVEGVADFMRRSGGRHDVGQVARHFGASVRTIERRFAKGIGLSPKLFSRQVRLQRVFSLIEGRHSVPWSQIAVASGCFDQAHLSREFRQLAGEPPEAFLRAEHQLAEHLTGLSKTAEPGS